MADTVVQAAAPQSTSQAPAQTEAPSPSTTPGQTPASPSQAAAPSPSLMSGTTDAPKAEPQAAQAPVGAPEKYELKLSENSPLKPEQLAQVETFAKSNNLTNQQAQEVLKSQEAFIKSQVETLQSQRHQEIEGWRKASLSDPEFGGEKLSASAEIAKRAMTKFGGDTMAKLLDETGFGNHPEVIRMFYRVGQAMSDGRMIPGNSTGGSTIPVEQKFYGTKK